ncbi:hypothetical protein BJ878DRAFT_540716 [Calycina marina]|uniref:C2H2-type domain-containing protein n=1 Tax=Calycina marina TaxID=1763456 RepID=A0A9P8CI10_9HELO|nr:hypothetical protein BJ878DRAFT_540716 [Calycina marina]
MAPFSPEPTGLVIESNRHDEQERAPTTPRPSISSSKLPPPNGVDGARTPTKANFEALGQKPLPAEPFPSAVTFAENPEKDALQRGNSHHSARSRDSGDVDMDMDGSEGEDDSDEESVAADGTRTKKKKSQRFWCTDYPPCNLNFTRSEHLARHIRKHTGERPFQCHCQRRFSRLDNLRQHAQTVHVNEDIPNDSLAASGTRFQRTIRTDRARPPGSRSRASTAGSQSACVRGHRHSQSASSIGSVASYTAGPDARRRPPSLLVMADIGPRPSIEKERPYTPSSYQYRPGSPVFSTPTSATFSTGGNSPRWGSAIQSPVTSHSRTRSLYNEHRTQSRRLSVPSSQNPFQSHTGHGPPPLGMNSNAPPYSPSMASGASTPTSSVYSRRDSISSVNEEYASRRRTWHPDSAAYATFTTRLQNAPTYYATGPPPQAPVVPSNAPPLGGMRLPPIKSFFTEPLAQTPARRQPSPMMIDTPGHRAPSRPTSQQWAQDFNHLELAQQTPPTDAASSWASDANRAVQAQAEVVRAQPHQQVRFEESPYSARIQQHFQHQSAPPITPPTAKRHGWYNGPVTPIAAQNPVIDPQLQRTSPEDSSSSEGVPGTPHSVTVAELHPSIVHSNGYVEHRSGMPAILSHDPRIIPSSRPAYQGRYQQNQETTYTYHGQQQQAQGAPKQTDGMSALDTLVAVATSEDNIAAAAY